MKALFSLLAVIMVLIVCRFNAGLAADFYDPASGVTLKSPEGYSVVDALDRSLDLGLQTPVRSYYLLGRGQVSAQTAEIHYLVSDEPASVLLAELQLRIIDAILRKNRRLLDRDAVELQGVSFANQLPMRALVLPGREVTVAVLAVGNDFAFYEQFLLDLSDRIPFGDTRDHPFSAEIHDVASRGIFRGYSSATGGIPTFRPDFGINRAELMKVVVLSSPGVDQQEVDEFVSEGSMKRIFP
ncbi:MAG: S-layer homology domain-containing protein, partial [bacterium]|nr:S-layer homology domain-containing protein [bacterium]